MSRSPMNPLLEQFLSEARDLLENTGKKLMQFRVTVDKEGQGRALILNNVLKDSNNDLRMTFNTTGLSAGIYTVRIEALPPRGDPIPDGWLTLEVR